MTKEQAIYEPEKPSITTHQRKEFHQWSKAFDSISATDKESEAEAWIAAALAILVKPNESRSGTPDSGTNQTKKGM